MLAPSEEQQVSLSMMLPDAFPHHEPEARGFLLLSAAELLEQRRHDMHLYLALGRWAHLGQVSGPFRRWRRFRPRPGRGRQGRASRTSASHHRAAVGPARRLTTLAALAMYGDASQGAKVLPRLDALGRGLADTIQASQPRRPPAPHRRPGPADHRQPQPNRQDPGPPAVTPGDLLAAARDLITRPDAATAGIWLRTAALLARQALEQAISAQWASFPETQHLRPAPCALS
jgi:hypothetical protein